MLTVKRIRYDGAEDIDYAARVLFYPAEGRGALSAGPTPHVGGRVTLVGTGAGSPDKFIDWDSGVIYVMNGAGSTVARYDLGNTPSINAAKETEVDVSGLKAA